MTFKLIVEKAENDTQTMFNGEVNCYPHVSANVETRDELVFVALTKLQAYGRG